jgi:phytoene synthase
MQESRTITRKSASNLALAFFLLPRAKRDGMSALYAFCREVDDAADEETAPVERRRAELQAWRDDIRRACEGGEPQKTVNRELQPFIKAHALPFGLFDELILGVEMDLDIKRYATYADLDLYCHRVASVVGLLSIEVFGYSDPRCRDYATHLGKALQLTNILRDVKTDAERGRIYLPLEELARHGVTEEEILASRYSERFFELANAVAVRAREFYRLSREALPARDRRSMAAGELMRDVYWALLRKLERQRFNVFGPAPIRVSRAQKIALILRVWFRLVSGTMVPSYGTS